MFETAEIERHLLKVLTTNKLVARQLMMRIKMVWFTGLRKAIFSMCYDLFKQTPTVISNELFAAELAKNYPDATDSEERDRYLTEWTLIQQSVVSEAPDALIVKLQERQQMDSVTDICTKTLEYLEKGDISGATGVLKSESVRLDSGVGLEKPMVEMTDITVLDGLIQERKAHPELYGGISTGFKRFDRKTGGLFKAEMTLIAAVTGVGKSTFLKQLTKNIVLGDMEETDPTKRIRPGRNVLHVTNEEHRDQVHLKYASLFTGIDYFEFKNATIEEGDLIAWRNEMERLRGDGYGRIFIKEIPQFATVGEIYQQFMEIEQAGFRVDVIVLDYLDHLAPMKKTWSENDEQAKVAWDCKGLCIDLNVPLVTATQAATVVEERQEKGRHFGKLNVYGSKRRVHAANGFIGILHNGNDVAQVESGERETVEDCDRFWTAEVLKSRDGATFSFELRHRVKTGAVEDEWWSRGANLPNTVKAEAGEVLEEHTEATKRAATLHEEVDPVVEEGRPAKKAAKSPGTAPDALESGEGRQGTPLAQDVSQKPSNAPQRNTTSPRGGFLARLKAQRAAQK